ncbi:hypothetical protein HK097_009621 [Rhizophlyctis rosea]|uniref:Uncharacterized protein n=1 Tax=Rhizophlyctis rosea TaxID=64517 RepID=A0AAD5S8N7_9FUNG|nr:hypothetical protein HK097_009621 [Rhizophlyctis rosea]
MWNTIVASNIFTNPFFNKAEYAHFVLYSAWHCDEEGNDDPDFATYTKDLVCNVPFTYNPAASPHIANSKMIAYSAEYFECKCDDTVVDGFFGILKDPKVVEIVVDDYKNVSVRAQSSVNGEKWAYAMVLPSREVMAENQIGLVSSEGSYLLSSLP